MMRRLYVSQDTSARAVGGTYCDRMIMEGEPFRLIEGMLIAACAIGATQGYIYCRHEYPAAARALEIHPDDARKLAVRSGQSVRVISGRSEIVMPVEVSARVAPGQLFARFHFPENNLNTLLSSSADEASRCPEYKVATVRLEKLKR